MSYRLLPQLGQGAYVSAEQAKQDKVEIGFGQWEHLGDYATANVAARAISQTEHVTSQGECLRVFRVLDSTRYGQNFTNTFTRDERSGRRANTSDHQFGSPLIAGHIHHRCTTPSASSFDADLNDPNDNVPATYHIQADLSLNPTRSFNHFDRADLVQDDIELPPPPLFSTRDAHIGGHEISLTNSDNVILHPAHARRASAEQWPTFRQDYFAAVDEYISSVLQSGYALDGLEGPSLLKNPTYQLRYIETYWEFQHPEPIALMHQLAPRIRAIGSFVRATEHLDDTSIEETQDQNAVSYRVGLSNGIELAIYAKTNKRIRLEIRHRMRNLSSGVDQLPTSFECYSIPQLDALIDRITRSAVRQLNRVIDVLTQDLDGDQINRSTYELIRAITTTCDRKIASSLWQGARHADVNQTTQELLLACLIVRNAYSVTSGDPNALIMRDLKRQNVVQNAGLMSRTYRLTAEYQRARQELLPLRL